MRKILAATVGTLALAALTTTTLAADMRVKAPVYKAPIVDPWNWSGVYIGANIGYSWGRSNTDINLTGAGALIVVNFLTNSPFDMNGVIGGGQLGFNLQNGNWVWGIEADIQASGQKGSTAFACLLVCTNGDAVAALRVVRGTFDQKLTWFGTLRGRVGGLFAPTVLAYLTGGLAYGEIETDGTLTGLTVPGLPTSTTFGTNSVTKAGWTVGAGLEGRLWGNWTGKIEYLYIDLGTVSTVATFPTNAPPLTATYNSRITDNILRVGINYKFDSGPVVARY